MLFLNNLIRAILALLFLTLVVIGGVKTGSFINEYFFSLDKNEPSYLIKSAGYCYPILKAGLAMLFASEVYSKKYFRAFASFGLWLPFASYSSLAIIPPAMADTNFAAAILFTMILQFSSLGFAFIIMDPSTHQREDQYGRRKQRAIDLHAPPSNEKVVSQFLKENITNAKGECVRARDLYNAYAEYCKKLRIAAVAERSFPSLIKANSIVHKRVSKGSFYYDILLKTTSLQDNSPAIHSPKRNSINSHRLEDVLQ